MTAGLARAEAIRHDAAGTSARLESVVDEAAVALVFNGQSPLVLMATPLALDDLVYGWALSEGVIDSVAQLQILDIVAQGSAWQVEASIADSLMPRLTALSRHGSPNSACGICGTERLADALRAPRAGLRQPAAAWPAVADLPSLLHTFVTNQAINQQTGGAHAAAWLDAQGLLLREDVGRHNALDKLIGARARAGRDQESGLLLMSSRASYELVHKAISAGIGRMLTMSAPTRAAIALAQRFELDLAGFTRDQGFTHYCAVSDDP